MGLAEPLNADQWSRNHIQSFVDFCQRLLEAGVDHTTVAALLGQVDSVTVSRTYSHLDSAKDFLREELLRASGARTSPV